MDARHPLTPLDRQHARLVRAHRKPVHVLLTKADKLSRQAAQRTADRKRGGAVATVSGGERAAVLQR